MWSGFLNGSMLLKNALKNAFYLKFTIITKRVYPATKKKKLTSLRSLTSCGLHQLYSWPEQFFNKNLMMFTKCRLWFVWPPSCFNSLFNSCNWKYLKTDQRRLFIRKLLDFIIPDLFSNLKNICFLVCWELKGSSCE